MTEREKLIENLKNIEIYVSLRKKRLGTVLKHWHFEAVADWIHKEYTLPPNDEVMNILRKMYDERVLSHSTGYNDTMFKAREILRRHGR